MKHEYPGQYRFKTVSRYYAYHGTTLATLDAGGMGERKSKFEPYSGDFVHVPPPYCYRCPFGLSYPSCGLACGALRRARASAHPEALGPPSRPS